MIKEQLNVIPDVFYAVRAWQLKRQCIHESGPVREIQIEQRPVRESDSGERFVTDVVRKEFEFNV